jgi:hypothetical protein
MTTLAILKAKIADDLTRSDLSSQIATAITDAIRAYSDAPYYFNQSRSMSFSTVADQWDYDSTDDANIGLIRRIRGVSVSDGSNAYDITPIEQHEMELLTDNGLNASRGEPMHYSWFGQVMCLYPIPDAAYTVRVVGSISKAAPASDDETGNVWMTEADDLIRARAKVEIAVHTTRDPDMAQAAGAAEAAAVERLRVKTSRLAGTRTNTPTEF